VVEEVVQILKLAKVVPVEVEDKLLIYKTID